MRRRIANPNAFDSQSAAAPGRRNEHRHRAVGRYRAIESHLGSLAEVSLKDSTRPIGPGRLRPWRWDNAPRDRQPTIWVPPDALVLCPRSLGRSGIRRTLDGLSQSDRAVRDWAPRAGRLFSGARHGRRAPAHTPPGDEACFAHSCSLLRKSLTVKAIRQQAKRGTGVSCAYQLASQSRPRSSIQFLAFGNHRPGARQNKTDTLRFDAVRRVFFVAPGYFENSFRFQRCRAFEHSLNSPGGLTSPGERRMPFYLTRFSYTPETWARLVRNPEDRRAAAQQYIESVGGKLHGFWYAFGDHDAYTL